MASKYIGSLLFILFVSIAKGSGDKPDGLTSLSADAITVRSIEGADPAKEFAKYVHRGQIFFLGVKGFTIRVPGVTDYERRYSGKIPLRVIAGTTDAFENETERKLSHNAADFAKKFNRLVDEYLSKQK